MAYFETNFIGSAFVTFRLESFKEYILKRFKEDRKIFKIKGNQLLIEQSNHPSDIKWENLATDAEVRGKTVLFSRFIMACVLIVSFILIGFLNVISYKASEFLFDYLGQSSVTSDWISILTTFINFMISLINTILLTISEKMVKW